MNNIGRERKGLMKKVIAVNDNWLYAKGFDPKCLEPNYDWGRFTCVGLPHNNLEVKLNNFDSTDMQIISTYSRILIVPEKYNGSRLLLKFEGVSSYCELYVNGLFVTSHKGDTPFTADITAPVKYDFENQIIIKVDSKIKKEVPSSGVNGPMISYGGIHREMYLYVLEGANIEDVFITTAVNYGEEKNLTLYVKLYDFYPDTFVGGEILDGGGKTVGKIDGKTVLSDRATLKGVVADGQFWDCENPTLYTAVLRLKNEKDTLDIHKIIFGFRTAVFKRDGFYLNGKQLKLVGLNRMDSYPYVGKAMPRSQQISDAKNLKELGCNVVRTHGLASLDFIAECNRIGLLVIEDISGDGYIGKGEWRDALIQNIADMVKRDRNNPCIISWGVRVNNSVDCDELYFKTNKAAHDNDPTRATLGARSFMGSRMFEDVFAFNDYPKGRTLSKLGKTSKLFVPYIVSEHTGKSFPVKTYDDENIRLQHALRHLNVIDKALGSNSISGAIGMSMCDFNSSLHKGSGDSINHYGVCDYFRNNKLAALAYKSQKLPVLEVSSNLSPDEFSGKLYVFTNCEYVKLYRDEAYVGTFYPAKKIYKNLSHAPIIVTDLIGNLLKDTEGFSALQAKLFKKLIKKIDGVGFLGLSFYYKIILKCLKAALKISDEDFKKLIDKYSLYSSQPKKFKVVACEGDAEVMEKTFGHIGSKDNRLVVKCDNTKLSCSKTYEVARFSLEAVDKYNSRLCYDFSPIEIIAEGAVQLIGPKWVSLQGGVLGFYVKSISAGAGSVKIVSGWGEQTIDMEVVYETVEKL